MRRLWGVVMVALALAVGPASAPAAEPQRFSVRSFDGTIIYANFFTAEGLEPGRRASTIFFGPGYSGGGATDPEGESDEVTGGVGVGPLRHAGYNVVTWDPRGFGESGGTVQINSPEHEARDVQALIDAVARRSEVRLDAPGDPRMGMTGISYGGGIQFVTAQRDPRVDVIVPTIAWHSLLTSLFKEGAVKAGWGLLLCGMGESGGLADGIFAPHGIETGGHDPVITRTCVNGVVTGTAPEGEDLEWFAARGPAALVRRIRIPTFVVHGTVDTLFTLREAMDNHAILKTNRVPLKMLWYCGGHGICRTGSGPQGRLERRVIAWLDRHLRGRATATGPPFEWIADDGRWRSARGFPLPAPARLRGSGSGVLPLQGAGSSGVAIAATPAPPGTSLEIEVEPAPREVDVVGEPRLRMTYSGTGAPGSTWVYAQVVDAERGLVAGNVVTPIPVILDGVERTVERPLEPVALRAPAGKRYRVQIVPSTTLYYPQQSLGALQVSAARVSLPVADAAAARASPAERAGSRAPRPRLRLIAGCRRARVAGADVARVRRVAFARPGKRRRVDARRPFTVAWAGSPRVRAQIQLRDGRTAVRRAVAPRCSPRYTG